jgi:hypothetical protein
MTRTSMMMLGMTLAMAMILGGCRSTGGASACTPGDQKTCSCDDGSDGHMKCAADGDSWGTCRCGGGEDLCYFDGVEIDCNSDICAAVCEDSDGLLVCTDLASDPYNCGGCGSTCFDGVCLDGNCESSSYVCEDYALTTCYDGQGYEYCADLLTDDYNCGACGYECAMGCDGLGSCI